MIAVDLFTVDTVWLQRLYVLFFIELAAAACTWLAVPHPNATWVTQQARQFAWMLPRPAEPFRFLIRDPTRNLRRRLTTCFAAMVWRFFVRQFVRPRQTVSRNAS